VKLLRAGDFGKSPWKNGAGVTHEIFRRAGPTGLLWRLSIAEVKANGRFSEFPGLARILTVIAGAGLKLSASGRIFSALPLRPVGFSGDLALNCRLIRGAVLNFNVIFDPRLMDASVRLVDGPAAPGLVHADGREFLFYCLEGQLGVAAGEILDAGSALLFDRPTDAIDWTSMARGLLLTLERRR
jgi:uncharacterized protein